MGFFLLSFVIILADDFVLLNKHYYYISEIIQLDFDKFRLRGGWRWEVVAAL